MRPFGVSLMLAGHDANGPQLYQIDPSGTFFAWKASAIGKNMVNAKTFLEKRYADDLELEDAIDTALLTLKESFEGEMSGDNIEVRVTSSLLMYLSASCHFQNVSLLLRRIMDVVRLPMLEDLGEKE